MPPVAKITKEMIIDVAFEITKEKGVENVNARTISEKLGCSTQPVMYYFAKIEDIKKAVYAKLNLYHTEYLMNVKNPQDNFLLEIGLNYIRFAVEKPNLFKFLFQSGFTVENSIIEMIDSEDIKPVLMAMQKETKLNMEDMKEVFLIIALFAHGYASMFANNSLEYDEKVIASHLTQAYQGAMLAIKNKGEVNKNE